MSTTLPLQGNLPLKKAFPANVWTHENEVSSDGEVKEVDLLLPPGSRELKGKYTVVDGKILNGQFKWEPFDQKTHLMNEGFAQVGLYYALTDVQLYLKRLGFNIEAAMAKKHAGRYHPILAHSGGTTEMNAWYSPQDDDLTFGTSDGKFRTDGDYEIPIHEFGHDVGDHVNPDLLKFWASEGGAIHEGFGDMLAAFYDDDAEMSEGFWVALGNSPSKTEGLRKLNNDLTLDEAGTEVHDRSRAYSGFGWRLKEKLMTYGLTSRQASDLMAKISFEHISHYTTSQPKPSDFVNAMVRALDHIPNPWEKRVVNFDRFKDDMIAEAIKRGMIKDSSEVEKEKPAVQLVFNFVQPKTLVRQNISEEAILDNAKRGIGRAFAIDQRPTHSSESAGVVRKTYQQWYVLQTLKVAKPVRARVLGASLIVGLEKSGTTSFVSGRDLADFKPENVDETIRLSPAAAASAAKSKATSTEQSTSNARRDFVLRTASMFLDRETRPSEYDEMERMIIASRDVPIDEKLKLQRLQMEDRIASEAVKKSRNMPASELVILPVKGKNKKYERELFYQFKMGLSLYYVNAKTGAVRIERDVLW